AERKFQTYTLQFRIDNFFIGINPVKSSEAGTGGYLIEIYEEKSPSENIRRIFEVDETPVEIFDEIIKKKRMSNTNCYAAQIEANTPEFDIIFNKTYGLKGKEKVYRRWWHVHGKVYGNFTSIIDIDGDGNPDRISYGDKTLELYSGKSFEKNKDMIAGGIKLFEKARKYFAENVGYF
ncbi:MAG: hypothetical protein M1416_01885, partial [Candidatus Pacearchaeota archaeon]|nr:hypothetical protein [Candidatus Pacearchaeota archaeon]